MGREEAPGPGYSPPRCSLGLSLVAVDEQDTGPEGGAADGERRDRLEVVVVGEGDEN